MNWRRGLFRLWIVGTALFVIAVAFVSYSEIKAQFDDALKNTTFEVQTGARSKFKRPIWRQRKLWLGRCRKALSLRSRQTRGRPLDGGQASQSASRWRCWFSERPWCGLSQGSLPNGLEPANTL